MCGGVMERGAETLPFSPGPAVAAARVGTNRTASMRFIRDLLESLLALPILTRALPGRVKIPAVLRSVVAVATRRNPVRGGIAPGQFKGDQDWISPRPFHEQALAVGVAPAPPRVAQCDQVEARNDVPRAVVLDDAVERGFKAERQWPVGGGGLGGFVIAAQAG